MGDMLNPWWSMAYIQKSWLHPVAANVCNRGKEREMLYIFPFLFPPVLSADAIVGFKDGQAEYAPTMKAQTNRPRRQLFLM